MPASATHLCSIEVAIAHGYIQIAFVIIQIAFVIGRDPCVGLPNLPRPSVSRGCSRRRVDAEYRHGMPLLPSDCRPVSCAEGHFGGLR